MAKKNKVTLDFSGFEEVAEKIDKFGGDLKDIFNKALTECGKKITKDVIEAVKPQNLPAKGKFSYGWTKQSIIRSPVVKWRGPCAEMSVGFDKRKQGAGGYLISGTPRRKGNAGMKPAPMLNRIFKGKRYMSQRKKEMKAIFEKEAQKLLKKL